MLLRNSLSDNIYLSCGISNTQTRRSVDGEGAGYPGGDGVRDGGRNLNLTIRSDTQYWILMKQVENVKYHETFSNQNIFK